MDQPTLALLSFLLLSISSEAFSPCYIQQVCGGKTMLDQGYLKFVTAFESKSPIIRQCPSDASLKVSLAEIGLLDEEDDEEPVGGELGIYDNEDDDIDDDPVEEVVVDVGDLDEESEELGSSDDGEPPEWYTSAMRIQELRAQWRRHEMDTGSPEFQVAGMTERIAHVTKHLKRNPKDFSTRRGLVALVNKRRRLLNYLARSNATRYDEIVSSLGIRHKAPSRVDDRTERYGRFPPQKKEKKHLSGKKY